RTDRRDAGRLHQSDASYAVGVGQRPQLVVAEDPRRRNLGAGLATPGRHRSLARARVPDLRDRRPAGIWALGAVPVTATDRASDLAISARGGRLHGLRVLH